MYSNATTRNSSSISDELNRYQVHVITWNVGKHFPDNLSLRQILDLQPQQQSYQLNEQENIDGQQFPDIYAIGLQEINTQPQQQVFAIFKEDSWLLKIKDLLGSLDYVLVKSEQMQGIQLSVFVRRIHVSHLHDIEAICTRTGFGGIWGNKGAVAVRFSFYGCALVFVNAHLAAHDDRLDERIEHYQQILRNSRFSLAKYLEIYDHDYVFWFGDLNFRLSNDISSNELYEKLQNDQNLMDLFKYDQLTWVREITHEAFHGMNEGKINFPPTFKYKDGTSEYDLKRRPAWTDRILYGVQPSKSQPHQTLEIKQCTYNSHPSYCISDHKPVSALFHIKLCSPLRQEAYIKFHDIATWSISEVQTIKYSKMNDFQVGNHDWIGIFHKNYNSLRDYITYQYVNEMPSSSPEIDIDPHFANNHYLSHHSHNRDRPHSTQEEGSVCTINFTDNIKLKSDEEYILIYFQSTGLHGVTTVAGISNTFRAGNTSSPINFINID